MGCINDARVVVAGRQLVVILPTAIIAMAILAEKFKIWRWFIYLGGISGVTAWLWLAFEATTDREPLLSTSTRLATRYTKHLQMCFLTSLTLTNLQFLSNGIWLTGIAVATILTITRKTSSNKSPFVRYETRTQTLKIQGTKAS